MESEERYLARLGYEAYAKQTGTTWDALPMNGMRGWEEAAKAIAAQVIEWERLKRTSSNKCENP